MFAVIRTGGKQYRVAAEDLIKVDKVKGEPGEIVEFGEVLVVGGDSPLLGAPAVAGASVAAEVVEQGRGAKVIAFKKRRRKNSRRKRGHRQEFTLVRITEILTDGQRPTKAARPQPAAKAAEPPAAEASEHAAPEETGKAKPRSAKPAAKARAEKSGKDKTPAKAPAKRPTTKGKSGTKTGKEKTTKAKTK
jgi:large subunit ribosomal protein L21